MYFIILHIYITLELSKVGRPCGLKKVCNSQSSYLKISSLNIVEFDYLLSVFKVFYVLCMYLYWLKSHFTKRYSQFFINLQLTHIRHTMMPIMTITMMTITMMSITEMTISMMMTITKMTITVTIITIINSIQ
jgi:hypothetical protein